MIAKRELQNAIDEYKKAPATFANCEKLATYLVLFDHLYSDTQEVTKVERITEVVIDTDGESEFLRMIRGEDPRRIWAIMDELMQTIKLINPRLYDGVINKIEEY